MLAAELAAEAELGRVPDWLWDGESLPVPVEAIADSHYGLIVGVSDDLPTLAGLAPAGPIGGLLLPHRKEIWVDAAESARAPGRRRFTIAHEAGHWVLHCLGGPGARAEVVHCRASEVREAAAGEEGEAAADTGPAEGTGPVADPGPTPPPERGVGPRVIAGRDYPPEELDANQFAAALLMPHELVRREHERLGGEEARLARAFGVSPLAMQRRLWFLSVVEARQGPATHGDS